MIREKPYLYVDSNTNFFVMVPNLITNSLGTSWAGGPTPGVSVPISQFYIAQPGADNAGTINAALNSGLNLILTPGIYHLTNSILVTNPDTIVLGLGFPTLVPTNGNPAMVISDVDGVKVSGIIFDAGTTASPVVVGGRDSRPVPWIIRRTRSVCTTFAAGWADSSSARPPTA